MLKDEKIRQILISWRQKWLLFCKINGNLCELRYRGFDSIPLVRLSEIGRTELF